MCQGTGWETYIVDGYKYARECKCGALRRSIFAESLEFAEIPDAFKNVSLQDFREEVYENNTSKAMVCNVKKAITYWVKNFDKMLSDGYGLYISSETKGSGKTRFVIGLANYLMRVRNVKIKFSTSLQILNEIKACWDKDSETSESELLDDLSVVDILIIDDFGTERTDKSWINDRFYQIVNNRYMNNKMTIYTSNHSLDKIEYDERIVSRIEERTLPIPFPEESIRKRIAINKSKHMWEEILKSED